MVHLPQELLSHICSYLAIEQPPPRIWHDEPRDPFFLSHDDDIKIGTMLSLSLANSSFHHAVKPYLYRTIKHPIKVTKLLLRSLLVPHTAQLVQNLSTQTWTTGKEHWYEPPGPNYEPLPYALVETAMRDKGLSDGLVEDMHRGIKQGLEDALYALLLLTCTNLRLWKTAFDRVFSHTLVARTIREVNRTGVALQLLQEVTIGNADDEGTLDLSKVHDVLSVPSLRRIRGIAVTTDDILDYVWQVLPHRNVKDIGLDQAGVDGDSLSCLFRAYTCLETVSIELGGPQQYLDSMEDYSGIGDSLRQYGTKLLSLGVVRQDEFDEDNTLDRTPLGNLSTLTALRRLRISYDALFGGETVSNERPATWLQEVLPFSLEEFDLVHVVHDEPELLDEQLKSLMADERFSALRWIQVRRGDDDEDFPEEDILPAGWKVENMGWGFVLSKSAGGGGGEDEPIRGDGANCESPVSQGGPEQECGGP